MKFKKVNDDGRTFITTIFQEGDSDTEKYLSIGGHNFEMLAFDGISDDVIEDTIKGTITVNIGHFITTFDDAEKYLIGDGASQVVSIVRKCYRDKSCVIVNRIIVPDASNKWPWEEGCDPKYAAQWNEKDEEEAMDILRKYDLVPVKAVRTTL